jgi:hypothetical protein
VQTWLSRHRRPVLIAATAAAAGTALTLARR